MNDQISACCQPQGQQCYTEQMHTSCTSALCNLYNNYSWQLTAGHHPSPLIFPSRDAMMVCACKVSSVSNSLQEQTACSSFLPSCMWRSYMYSDLQTVSEPQVQHQSLSLHHLQARDSHSPWWHHQSHPVLWRECDCIGQICCHVEGNAHPNEALEELVVCVVKFRCQLNKGRCVTYWVYKCSAKSGHTEHSVGESSRTGVFKARNQDQLGICHSLIYIFIHGLWYMHILQTKVKIHHIWHYKQDVIYQQQTGNHHITPQQGLDVLILSLSHCTMLRGSLSTMWRIIMLRGIRMSQVVFFNHWANRVFSLHIIHCQFLSPSNHFLYNFLVILPIILFFSLVFPLYFQLEFPSEPTRVDEAVNDP